MGAIISQYIHLSIRPYGHISIHFQSEEVRFCLFGLFLFAILWGVERSGFSIVRAKTAEVVCL